MITSLVTGSTAEPLTIDEAKDHLRVTGAERDALIEALIKAARQWCESYTHRALITQIWDGYLDGFPSVIELPYPPLQSVTAASFTYVDTDGNTTQVTETVYTVDTAREPGRVYEAYNQWWPTARQIPKSISIRFVAGYGAAGSSVPEPLRQAMRLELENLYDHSGTSAELRTAAEALAGPYIVHGFA